MQTPAPTSRLQHLMTALRRILVAAFCAASLAAGMASSPALAQNANYDLLKAIDKQDVEEVERLLRTGVNPDTRRRSSKEPALIIATRLNNLGLINALIAAGANVDIQDPDRGETPLMLRSIAGDTATMRVLLDAGADANATDRSLETALMKAVRGRQARAVALLIEHGADPHKQDVTGNSAYDYAQASRHRRIQNLLENAN